MGLTFKIDKIISTNINKLKGKNKMKFYVVGYDCGIDGTEVTQLVCAYSFEDAINYAENSAIELYEDLELAPTLFEFDGTEKEYEEFAEECLFNAIGFWCREFDEKQDQNLIQSLGVIEINKNGN